MGWFRHRARVAYNRSKPSPFWADLTFEEFLRGSTERSETYFWNEPGTMPEITAETFRSIELPELSRTLGDIRAIREVTHAPGGTCAVKVALPMPGYPGLKALTEQIESVARQVDPTLTQVDVQYGLDIKGPQSGGSVGLRAKNVIAVGSGKGGVGKSTVAASLAYALQSLGANVGLLDADVYGPSIPHLTGAVGRPEVREHINPNGAVVQRIHPVQHHGLAIMSIGFLVPEQEAVIWRGPMLHKLLTQFVSETEWGPLDYLVVDMPPGTGDVALTLSQMFSLAGAVVVCTPQKVALLDAIKAIAMYQKVNIPILGVVENMTGELFGRGGAEQAARERGLPFLGEIPSDATIRIRGDDSELQRLLSEESPSQDVLRGVAANLALELARQHFSKPAAPTLEILQ